MEARVESIEAYMEYVYMQQPKPTNTTGVPVTLSVIDSNNNYRQIGTTTTNADGFYSFQWTPDITGKYTVHATFDGSESYWPSDTVNAFSVGEPEATPSPVPTQVQSAADLYLLPGIIGIVVAILVVGVVLALLVTRKRP